MRLALTFLMHMLKLITDIRNHSGQVANSHPPLGMCRLPGSIFFAAWKKIVQAASGKSWSVGMELGLDCMQFINQQMMSVLKV